MLSISIAISLLALCSTLETLELKYRIEEELPSGTFVGDVVRDANLEKIYDVNTLEKLQFLFLRQQQLSSGFVIDVSTGVIRVQERIDREAICPSLDVCNIRLDIGVRPVQHFLMIRVIVSIIDVNDNWPHFTDKEQVVNQ